MSEVKMGVYGKFNDSLGGYTITNLPKVGSYEYIYKNQEILVKVDQYGIVVAQIDAPTGDALIKREKREFCSPIRVCFDDGNGLKSSFDACKADAIKIEFLPEKATYSLTFGDLMVVSELLVPSNGREFAITTTFKNLSDKDKTLNVMPIVYPYVNPLMMAPWDKPEWYTKTEYFDCERTLFKTTKYSVAGNEKERRFFYAVCDKKLSDIEISAERLWERTDCFSKVPNVKNQNCCDTLYSFEQCFSGVSKVLVKGGEKETLTLVFSCALPSENSDLILNKSSELLEEKNRNNELIALQNAYKELFNVNFVQTKDEKFNRFINGFLPLELSWVSSLDRGWPTGMRGVRDASNDFQGYLFYDSGLCSEIIENIFSKQRSDGWYPRQVPFGGSDKFDLRKFVDSACFFTEFVYDYLCYTDDYSILQKNFGFYDCDQKESGLNHLVKGVEYLMNSENVGEHGLVKMQGGDWLDSLASAGQKGRGETVMVSCQLVMCIDYLTKILKKLGLPIKEEYQNFAKTLTENVNNTAFNEDGFYSAVFTDEGEWIFSIQDPDGEKRVYAPTNAYAVISGVAKGKEKRVLDNVLSLKTDKGFKLFSTPLGVKKINGIGKMGTGDFQPYFAENGSVYNHGSQAFVLRALAEVGDHQSFYDVLGFTLPYYEEKHSEKDICGAPYAITNCYHLVPSFSGRMGFSFLTGSVAMIERAVYNWLFGIRFKIEDIEIKPCIPKEFADSQVHLKYLDKKLMVKYVGYGSKIIKAEMQGEELLVSKDERTIKFNKKEIKGEDVLVTVFLKD